MSDQTATRRNVQVDDGSEIGARWTLAVTAGPDAGLRVDIDPARSTRLLAGLSSTCELRLTDRSVSRRHVALDVTASGLRVVDLASTNGTTVNGVRVVEALLRGGEIVRIGATAIEVRRATEPSPYALPTELRFGRLIGTSPAMRRAFPIFARLAVSSIPVVIEGETGTGKELLAEALHEAGSRARAAYVVVDCAAGSDEVLAVALREADGGTIFLDEIALLEPSAQARLVRALEVGEVHDGASPVRVAARVIASTQRDLDREVLAGRFREDLFFAFTSGFVQLPPLRERKGDVATLTRHFWRTLGRDERPIPPGLIERFEEHAWPGNVRELQSAVARVLTLGEVAADDLGPTMQTRSPSLDELADETVATGVPLTLARERIVAEFERRYIRRVLERYQGNVSRAAIASGIGRRYLQTLKARRLPEK
jgi:DNA-binding NtrC family response regulator